jgi:hypothetical protein
VIARLCASLALLGGCAAAGPSFPVVADVSDVDLQWKPRAGMRLVQRITTDVEMSGPLTGPVSAKDRKQHFVFTRTMEVPSVADAHFDVRFVQDGWLVPATVRLSRGWVPEGVSFDNPALSEQDRALLDAAVKRLVQPLEQGAQLFGRWRVGETKPFAIRFTGLPDTSGSGTGEMTLRRVVMLDGRRAAEFDWRGTSEFLFTGEPGRGMPGRMAIAGKEWRDLATGVALRVTATAQAEFTRQGQRTRVEYESVEALDLAASTL